MFNFSQASRVGRGALPVTAGALWAARWLAPPQAQETSPVLKINAEAAKAEIEVKPLRGDIYVLMGSGGIVDAGIGVSKPRLSKALSGTSNAPIKYVVNTYWHWEHTDGNGWMNEQGATIVAHPNTLKHMSTRTRADYWNYTFEPFPEKSRPTTLVGKDKTVNFAGQKVQLRNFNDGHADGDTGCVFPKGRCAGTGRHLLEYHLSQQGAQGLHAEDLGCTRSRIRR